MYRDTNCKLQAHRGVSTDAPENTMAAFRLAVEQGYDIVEFDPKFTKDGVCILLHDRTLNKTGRVAGERLTEENAYIADKTFSELADIDVGEWFDKKYCGEHIPTLSQALDYLRSVGMECKIDNVVESFTPEQRAIVFDTVERHGGDKVGLTCARLELLEAYARRFPRAPLHYDGPVTEDTLAALSEISAGHRTTVWMRLNNKATAWNTNSYVTDEYAALVKRHGFSLGVWILHTEEEMREALRLGADIVETTGGIKPY